MQSETIGVREFLTFLSPAGQKQIVDFIQKAKADRGTNWLPEIKAEFPMFSFIAELVADRDAEDAFTELQNQFPTYPLNFVKRELLALHGTLRAEIDKPR